MSTVSPSGSAPAGSSEPGWYPDPFAPNDETRRRWWDGTQWAGTTHWDGNRWVGDAAASGPPPKKRRTWLWVTVIVSAFVLAAGGCGVLLIIGVGLDQATTHDLLATDFTKSAEPFHEGSSRASGPYTFATDDGRYTITATADGGDRANSVGEFARVAFTVDIDTTVTGLQSGRQATLSCEEHDNSGDGYRLVVTDQDASLLRIENGKTTTLDSDDRAGIDGETHRLQLSCHQGFPNLTDQQVTASIDGEEVVSAGDGDPPVDGYYYAGLGFWGAQTGDTVSFGDVTATVPE